MNVPLAEYGRPSTFDQLVLEKSNKEALKRIIQEPETMPHLLFYGPPGTGKTSSARVIAQEILGNKTDFNYLELNASSERGVDVVRDQISKFVATNSFVNLDAPKAPYKIVVLDEACSLTNDAQNALRNIMETFASNSRFIFCCNNIEKIIPALQSRTLKFYMNYVDLDKMYQRIKQIATSTGNYSDIQIKKACENSKGDFRKAYNALQGGFPSEIENLDTLAQILTDKANSLKTVREILESKRQFLQDNFKELIEKMMYNLPSTLELFDRLARTQFAIIQGCRSTTQLLGWFDYFKSHV